MKEATTQLKKLCREQRLKNFRRNAQILTELKNKKRKRKTLGKFKMPPLSVLGVIKKYGRSDIKDAPELRYTGAFYKIRVIHWI